MPLRLDIVSDSEHPKHAYVVGTCCQTWSVKFFNCHKHYTSLEAQAAAAIAWNAAPRPVDMLKTVEMFSERVAQAAPTSVVESGPAMHGTTCRG